jgi:lysyl-tRNA synthetase class 2
MADAAPPTEAVANLHLDEVTGEKVSKSELKKRQKQRSKDEEKKKREAAAPPKPVKKSNAEADEKELNPNVRYCSKVNKGRTDGYPFFYSNISRYGHAP